MKQMSAAGRKSLVFILASLGTASCVIAADEDIFFSELPIVASVSRLPQRLADAPTAVTVIGHDIIKASGARDLNDVLRLVPGFQTFPNTTESARVTYHGLTDDEFSPRLQVLIDGRSQYSPLYRDGVNWLNIPVAIEDIERIEVVRGTNNVSFGSNAFLGVVNIITIDPTLVKGVSVSTNQGNQGVRDYTLRSGGKIGETGSLRFTYQQKDDDGLTDRADWRDSNSRRLLDLRTDWQLSNRDVLEVSLGRSESTNQKGRLSSKEVAGVKTFLNEDNPGNPIRPYDQQSTYAQFHWRHILSSDSDFRLRYAYRRDKASEAYVQRLADTYYDENRVGSNNYLVKVDSVGGESETHDLEAQYTGSPSEHIRFVLGSGWRWDSLESPYNFYDKGVVHRDIGRVFSSLEWRPSHFFTGNLGLAIERDSLGGTHESPRASANFHLTPENTIRVGYSKAYRTGSMLDYVGDRRNVAYAKEDGTRIAAGDVYRRRFVGDPNLPAEKLETTELGYLADWKAQRMSLDIRVFREHIPNRSMELDMSIDRSLCPTTTNLCEDRYIGSYLGVPAKAPEFRVTMPIQDVKIRGIEYQWRWQPFESTRLMVSQAFVDTASRLTVSTDANGYLPGGKIKLRQFSSAPEKTGPSQQQRTQDLTERSSPSHSTSVLIMQKLPYDLDFSLAGYWVGNSKWSRNTYTVGYQRYDARLGWPFKMAGQKGELAYTMQSISSHAEYQGFVYDVGDLYSRIVERRQWISLRLDF